MNEQSKTHDEMYDIVHAYCMSIENCGQCDLDYMCIFGPAEFDRGELAAAYRIVTSDETDVSDVDLSVLF